jgi:hypothetical protein
MLGDHQDEFDARNLFLQLTLGLASAARTLDGLMARHGRSVTRASPGAPAESAPGDELLLDFMLGLASFRDRVGGALSAARQPARLLPASPRDTKVTGILR